MSGHSSVVVYNPKNGSVAVVLANLRPSYIETQFSLHWPILGMLSAELP
ncbi:MAG: hypothetical protein ACI9WU_002957 [Myxococcota bacterium]|jgi:hypothetical protein